MGSTQQSQNDVILSPQLSVVTPGTPVRFSTTDIFTRSFMVAANPANVGTIRIAPAEAQASTVNSIQLAPGQSFRKSADNYGGLDAMLNLKTWWFDGTDTSDKVVVIYQQTVQETARGLKVV